MAATQARNGQPGNYNATLPTLTDGQTAGFQFGSGGETIVTLLTALAQSTDSVLVYPRGSNYANLTADTLVQTGAGKLTGIFVAAASASPLIKVWDFTSASGAILVNTFTPVAATYYPFPNVRYTTGLFVDIGGTVDITVFYDPTST